MRRCEDAKMRRCEGAKVRRCEGAKVRRREDAKRGRGEEYLIRIHSAIKIHNSKLSHRSAG
jgi:hypothetical protein